MKQNQIIAVEKGVKSQTKRTITDAYHKLQKSALLEGIARTYDPKDDDGDKFPAEKKVVQVRVEEELETVSAALTELFDVTYTKDVGNTEAKADVVVDGVTLAPGVPVTYLLFLEKQLVDLHTFISKLPVLDASEEWHLDEAKNCFVTEPVATQKTKMVKRPLVLAEATDKHPAQVTTFDEQVPIGTWTTLKFSGAISAMRKTQLLGRVTTLQKAVKIAREEANTTQIQKKEVGKKIFEWLLNS